MKGLTSLISLLILGTLMLNAAEPAPPPLVSFPQGNAIWTVAIRFLQNEKRAAELPPEAGFVDEWKLKYVEVIRSGAFTRGRYVWESGKTSESWWLQNPPGLLEENPANKQITFESMAVGATPSIPDVSLFAWVTPAALVGRQNYKGRMCFYYETMAPRPGQAPEFITGVKVEDSVHRAWIDAETLLPVAMDDTVCLYEFAFQNTPVPVLELPPRFQAELTKIRNAKPDPKYKGKKRSWES